ncbi:uncharacterized protein LOC107791056 [Nicotiana tabacum]|uniref:Uncharacterized protein LOC107791056 n=1 Tax=Nicotiana tabacum TaxID=4097 RepID=A0AC58T4G7_TOBAC
MVDGKWKRERFREKYWYQWDRCNAIVLSWLMNYVAQNLISGIAYTMNAQTVWEELRERFDKVDGSRSFNLHTDIATLTQGTLSISTYYSKLKDLWNEFEALVPLPGCDCPKSKDFVVFLQRLKLYQFSMGLNANYQARSQILLMSPLPTVNQAYAMLMSDENQKAIVANSGILGVSPPNINSGRYDSTALYSSKTRGNQKFRKNYNLYYEVCKMKGHTKENYYKIVGYPSDFKYKKKWGVGGSSAYNAITETSSIHVHSPTQKMSAQVIGQYMETQPAQREVQATHLGVQNQNPQLGACTFTKEQYDQIVQLLHKVSPSTASANTTGKSSIFLVSDSKPDWIIDTGATNHMVTDINLINKYSISEPIVPKKVFLPNRDITHVAYIGTSSISANNCLMNDFSNGKVKAIGKEDNGLYLLLKHNARTIKAFTLAAQGREAVDITLCVCLCAKQTRVPFPSTSIKSTTYFYLIYLDVWGPYKTATFDGNRFFLTVIDDFSRMTWIFLLRLKSDICLFRTLGIVHQRTCAYTPQQNGVAERKHRYILEVTRAIRFQVHIPIKFWRQCVLAAVYLINKMPSPLMDGVSPYERLYAKKPDLGHLRVIGFLCYAKQVHEADKLLSRVNPTVHMGYSPTQKGYILYDLTSHSFIVSKDVAFREEVFPFSSTKSVPPPLFVDSHSSSYHSEPPGIAHTLNDPAAIEVENEDLTQRVCQSPDVGNPIRSRCVDTTTSSQSTSVYLVTQDTNPTLRKSTRTKQPPIWMKDFVSLNNHKDVPYAISNYLSYDTLSPKYQTYIEATSTIVEPSSYEEAIKDPKWVEAMKAEITALEDNHT